LEKVGGVPERGDRVRGQSIEWFISVRVSHSLSAAWPILASM
jgi:hypothetical protein